MTKPIAETPMTREELDFDLKVTLGAIIHDCGIEGTSRIVGLVMLARKWRDQRDMDALTALSQALRGQEP